MGKQRGAADIADETMSKNKFTTDHFLLILLTVTAFVPGISLRITTFGFTWTVYRAAVFLALFFVVAGAVPIRIGDHSLLHKWILFMLFWLCYGFALLFLGRYSDRHNGLLELLSVFGGAVVFYVMRHILADTKNRKTAITLIYWMLNLMILIGLIEIAAGKHLSTSGFNDPGSSLYELVNRRQATGLMYNMNDFSAMITCMCPVLLYRGLGFKRAPTMLGVLLINLANDATTCTLSILVFVGFYFLIIMGGRKRSAVVYKMIFWFLFIAALAFVVFFPHESIGGIGFFGALSRQISNFRSGSGSLYHRVLIYGETIRAWLSTGMLGMGPAGFSRYFSLYQSQTGLVNPHSLLFEILSQYGILVTGGFVFMLIRSYFAGRELYRAKDKLEQSAGLILMAYVIVYFFASFAPSSFIKYPYQWLLLSVMCSFPDNIETDVPTERKAGDAI